MTILKAKIDGVYQAVLSGYNSNVWVGPEAPDDPSMQFWVDTDATLPVVPWTNVVFQNNWASIDGVRTVQYRKMDDLVYIRGVAQNMSTINPALPIFTLPVGFRPSRGVTSVQLISGAAKVGAISMATDGVVTCDGSLTAAGSWTFLDGIQFSITV